MRLHLIYPSWRKLERQTEFHLPPHGPVVFAAAVPGDVEIVFTDDNREPLDEKAFTEPADLVAMSVMLTCQLPRAFAIADRFRAQGTPVIFGGIATQLHPEEVALHADSVFLGEVEGRFEQVIADFKQRRLRPVYDYWRNPPDISLVGPARRDILKRGLYNYRGVQMVDLVHASRGCRFNCFPCCVGYLGGKVHRPRPIDAVIEEMEGISNNRMFIVDNSLAQDKAWLKDLFRAMIPLKKKWVSHPVMYDDEVLDLAAQAGCWYVYQAVFDTSEVIERRIAQLKDHGIAIEGTILLGTDDQDEDYIKRLVEFLCRKELDIAEFTILTPFPHSPIRAKFEAENRILSNDWSEYTCDRVVYQPKLITPEKLRELYHYAWDTFYADGGYQIKMGELLRKVMLREMNDGTYRRYDPRKPRSFAGKQAQRRNAP